MVEGAGVPGRSWWQQPFRMFQTNLRETDAGMDVDAAVDHIRDFGADAWLLNVGGILSWFPTALAVQTPNPLLSLRASGDLVADALRAAGERGLRVVARMDFSKVTRHLAEEHPEWCFVGPDGRWQEYNGLVSVCPSGPYYQHETEAILDEVIDRYDVDGFFLNWFGYNEVDYSRTYHGVCHCAACQRAYHERFREPLPAGPEDSAYPRWRGFTVERLEELTGRIRDHISGRAAARGRDLPLILGYRSDITFHEANNATERDLWPQLTGESVSAAATRHPGKPVLVNCVAFVDMPYRLAPEEPEHFAQYLVQAVARGANPSCYIMGAPGDIPYPCLDTARGIFRWHRSQQAVYAGLGSAADTVLVRPVNGERAEFEGLYNVLTELHLPFDVLDQDRIAEGLRSRPVSGPSRCTLLVLPGLGALDRDAAAAVDAFVATGGALLSTGDTGLRGTREEHGELACTGVTGPAAVRAGTELRNSYVSRYDAEEQSGPAVPLHGTYHYLDLTPAARPRFRVLSPAPFGPPEKCHGNELLDHPGAVSHPHGEGTAITVPWTIGTAYRELQLTAVRDMAEELLDELLGSRGRQLTTTLPPAVEVVAGRNGRQDVLHLLNLSGARRRSFAVPMLVHGATLTLPGRTGPWRVRALRAGRDCVTRRVEGGLEIDVPPFGRFEVLTLEQGDADGPSTGAKGMAERADARHSQRRDLQSGAADPG